MPIFELTKDSLVPVATTTFAAEHIRERYDLQRLLRDNIEAIAPRTLVLGEEYGEWVDAKRRLDLLCLDKDANLVVVELKRTEDGGHMELQAIRYAAMVSKLTFVQAVQAHSRYLGGKEKEDEARADILRFLDWEEPDEMAFARAVKIILVSAEFSKEITTAVLWLNEQGLDIRCVRLRPYALGERVLIDIQQLLPLPEAEEYTVHIRRKAAEERLSEGGGRDRTRYDLTIDGEVFLHQYKRRLFFLVFRALIQKGITPGQITDIFPQGKFLAVQGKCNGTEEFAEKVSALRAQDGRSYDLARYFVESDELIHAGGNTYAVSNQWSKKELPDLDKLIARHPQGGVQFVAREPEDS